MLIPHQSSAGGHRIRSGGDGERCGMLHTLHFICAAEVRQISFFFFYLFLFLCKNLQTQKYLFNLLLFLGSQTVKKKKKKKKQRPYEEVHASAKEALAFLAGNEFIEWCPSDKKYRPSLLGRAAVASSLGPDEALVRLMRRVGRMVLNLRSSHIALLL